MVIKNETTGKVLSDTAIKAKTFKQKAFGMLLAKKTDAMIFQTRFGIHTLFMKYPIDVLVLDSQNTIMLMKKELKPNRIFIWNPKYDLLIELPEGTIEKTKTKLSNILHVIATP